ncbi:MarR family transcriptional regulator [Rhodobacteraceae bacterium RKSG542]|nr:MarR family transcriptional regulator [Pseudovibrio flavus]
MQSPEKFDLEAFLPFRLNQAAERLSSEFQQVYKARYGMTRPEWRVLAHLGHFGTMTATEIGSRASIHKTKISRAVASLEKRRWLRRFQDETDRRWEHLELTPAGLQVFEDLGGEAVKLEATLKTLISKEERQELLRLLASLEAAE